MNPIRAFFRALALAFRLRGRAGWSEYWGFVLVSVAIYLAGAALWYGGEIRFFLEAYRSGVRGDELTRLLATAEPSAFRVAVLGSIEAIGGAGALLAASVGYMIVMLWYSIASLTAAVRRLHDTGRSGWWIGWTIPLGFALGLLAAATPMAMILMIPFALVALVTSLLVLVFCLLPGHPGPNRFGPGRDGMAFAAPSPQVPLTDMPQVPRMGSDDLRALRQSRMRGV
jgi:uncharacterized membrane protein YhaH (DUF805 family)